jgi:GT2 family glycosyltransferase
MPAFLSIIIPTHNRSGSLQRCMAALLSQEVSCDWNMIIVDDCSDDETPSIGRGLSAQFPNVQYIRNAENAGRCRTRNTGIDATSAEIIVMLDDDIVVADNCIEAHLLAHRSSGRGRIAVMGNVKYAPECIAGSNFGRYLQSRNLEFRNGQRIDPTDLPAKHFGAGNCSFRREDAMKVGLLDERFRYYGGEDIDFALRLKRSGVQLVYCEGAKGTHYDSVNLGRYKEKVVQVARNGLKIGIVETPELIESSGYKFLVPYDGARDSLIRLLVKSIIRFITNRRLIQGIERFAYWSDTKPSLYSKYLYYYLIAGWTVAGLAEPTSTSETVQYGNPK